MALDHTRDFWGKTAFAPEDLTATTPAWFFTRWVTHFCAPVFVFLAGTAAYLYGRTATRPQLSRFLLSRGLWLLVVELLVIDASWGAGWSSDFFVQVLWALGWSMVVLAGLVWLPMPALLAVGVGLVMGHNLWDGMSPEAWGDATALWTFLHVQGAVDFTLGGTALRLIVVYPLLPWPGVMALGYLLGMLYEADSQTRRRWLIGLGLLVCLVFVVLRLNNGYGDPRPWAIQEGGVPFTVMSFLNTSKYPPSLLFLTMTLGPALLFLAAADRLRGPASQSLAVFGRVPFFFYVIHVPIINAGAHLWTYWMYGEATNVMRGPEGFPVGYVPRLALVYVVWAALVLALYPLCRRYGRYKRVNKHRWWLGYL